MKHPIISALRLSLLVLLLCSGLYTVLVWGIAQCFPQKGKGELLSANDAVYYANIGQKFTADKYFQGRPSAVDYNAAGSGGSNKGPSNPDYLAIVRSRIDTFMAHNPGVRRGDIPVDLITASGSGLDPHISVQAASIQAQRVARARGLSVEQVQELISRNKEQPLAGPECVHVLKLNLSLDQFHQ